MLPSNLRIPTRDTVEYMNGLRMKRVARAKKLDRKAFDAYVGRQVELLASQATHSA